jgi:hypothetical protein
MSERYLAASRNLFLQPREGLTLIATRAFTRWGKILTGRKLNEGDISRFVSNVPNPPRGTGDDDYYIAQRDHKYIAQRNRHGSWDVLYGKRSERNNDPLYAPVAGNLSLTEAVDYISLHSSPKKGPGLFTPPSDLRRVAKMIA